MIQSQGVLSARGWSKKKIASESAAEENLIDCLEVRIAGDPDEEDVFFTHMTPRELSSVLGKRGTPVGRDAIATWLDEVGIRHRQIVKKLAGGEHVDRDAQFCRISELIAEYEASGNPWFSMDTKAKSDRASLLPAHQSGLLRYAL